MDLVDGRLRTSTARPDPDLIKDCVHCGFCLPTCPSYAVFEDEMDSPRGRIVLMRVGHEEGATISAEMVTHFDRCLGCMACVTACPSGVQYDKLIEQHAAADRAPRRPAARASARAGAAIFELFTHPGRLRALAPVLALAAAARRSTTRSANGCPQPAAAVAARARARRAGARRVSAAAGGHAGARRRRAAGSRSCRAASSACSSATSTPPPCACSPPRASRSTRPRSRAAAAR